MALVRVSHPRHALVQQVAQQGALRVLGAAHGKVPRRRTPGLLQPRQVSLKPARSAGDRAGPDDLVETPTAHPCRLEEAILDLQRLDLGVVEHMDALGLRMAIQGVQQRLAPAQKERVGVAQRQRSTQCLLEPYAAFAHPARDMLAFLDGHARERLVGLAAGHSHQIFEVLVDRVGPGQHIRGRIMGRAVIAHMARVAATKALGRGFGHQHRQPALGSLDCCAERSVAATGNQQVIGSEIRQERLALVTLQ